MKCALVICLVLLVGPTAATDVTPVQKVIQLMNGMLEKGKAEKHDEQVQFAAFKQFCDGTEAEKTRAIEEANEQIEVLKADIAKYASDAAQLAREIAVHEEDEAVWTGDIKAATNVRNIDKALYDKTHKDYSESIDALGRAIATLSGQSHDRKQALVEVKNLPRLTDFNPEAKRAIDAFLANDEDPAEDPAFLAVAAPEANAYEFQSGAIVDMLDKLKDKFIDERTKLEKEEMNSKNAFDMLMQDLNAQIAQAKTDISEKSAARAGKLQAKGSAEGDLEDTTTIRDADAKYLEDLTAECEQKASAFEQRQQLRAEEIEAIEKAIEIISSGSVSGAADKHLPALIQTSFVQIRSSARSPVQARVAQYLQTQAKRVNSRVLAALAERVNSDPFEKVKKMIRDLILKLTEEAGAEAEQKGWCDTELATNENTRNEKTEAVETLHAEIDELEASIAKLTEEITDLTSAVADLDEAMSTATKLREEENTKNTETISDAKEAQTAVAQALTVLKEFYAKAAEATSFVQRTKKPEIFDEPYQGMGGEAGGVVGMLEVIESDFARLEADTSAAEATALNEYDTFMSDSKIDKTKKNTDIKHKSAKKQDQEDSVTMKKGDLEGNQKELNAALAYFDKLKPTCVDSGVSYDDRVARRKEEIDSLQEALKILNGDSI